MIAAILLCPGVFWPGISRPADVFTDITAESGLEFTHFNGMTGEWYLPEMMGSGAALFDYDNDGDLDLYLVQGNMLPGEPADSKPLISAVGRLPLSDRLYRNDGTTTNGDPVFRDVTTSVGINQTGYGMGVTTGDVNGDGWIDLYVTNLVGNSLLINQAGKAFADVTTDSGTGDDRWSVSASLFDMDRDGDLDLYVGNYVNFSRKGHKPCRTADSARDYCSPLVYTAAPDRLYRNDGRGQFTDVSESAGIAAARGAALGVIADDFDGDGWIDLFVANDGSANRLWINQRNGKFVDDAAFAGVAVNMDGRPEASMGVDAADYDADGDTDLFMTHLSRETNTLYVNDGNGWFEDRTVATGLARLSFSQTGFGVAWIDYDNDRWLDLLVANGAVTRIAEQGETVLPLRQKNQLFRNERGQSFADVSETAGDVFAIAEVSRGAAFGDVDNDGDTDVVLTNNAGLARLLVNRVGNSSVWLGVRLIDQEGRLVTHGAMAGIVSSDGTTIWRPVRVDGSYASARDPRIVFGLEDSGGRKTVRVVWPNGARESWLGLDTGKYHELRRGSGLQDR